MSSYELFLHLGLLLAAKFNLYVSLRESHKWLNSHSDDSAENAVGETKTKRQQY